MCLVQTHLFLNDFGPRLSEPTNTSYIVNYELFLKCSQQSVLVRELALD